MINHVAHTQIYAQGVPEKNAQSLRTAILQAYATESCGLQQNVQKDNLHDKGQCLNTTMKYSLFCRWQVNYLKTKLTAKSLNL